MTLWDNWKKNRLQRQIDNNNDKIQVLNLQRQVLQKEKQVTDTQLLVEQARTELIKAQNDLDLAIKKNKPKRWIWSK